ncbi:MAG: hypothetical protein L0207_04665 [Chlamydiae bacterium]|nr:hypothetical protein [Chlamydiota bacterium]
MKQKLFLFLSFLPIVLLAQTIEEKKNSCEEKISEQSQIDFLASDLNQQIFSLRKEMEKISLEAFELQKGGGKDKDYQKLLEQMKVLQKEMALVQMKWKESIVDEMKKNGEEYALWDQEETTLSQLVMEYGASDFLYIIPPEMAATKLSMHSNIPIPRDCWSEMLEIILSQSGIGVKKINPFARQLYVFKQDPTAISAIVSRPEDLPIVKPNERIFYLFSPPAEQVKSAFQFFERFSDAKQVTLQQVAGKIAVIGLRDEIEKLLSLYRVVWEDRAGKISKVIPITKMHVKEMEKILHAFFGDMIEKVNKPPFSKVDQEGLSIFIPSQGNALVLLGNKEIIKRAEKIIHDTEEQLQDPAEMTVFLYTCKHSDPIDLAKILDRVYYSLIHALPEIRDNLDVFYSSRGAVQNTPDGYAPAQPLPVPPQTLKPDVAAKVEVEQGQQDHFIPDPKTGTILMVVRRDVLGKIKELIRRLDIPKKMVQIEVLLFEKRLSNQSSFGLNLLKLGSAKNGVRYDGPNPPGPNGLDDPVGEGVLAFLFSGKKSSHFPAFDLAYSFLMTQEDIQLNAAPSVITVNQTPATISIVEEISINNGAAPIDTNKGIAFEKSFTRARYGITIVLTPIVHLPDEEDGCEDKKGFVTLQTDITFDTTKQSVDDRPPVDKRHIENEVRVEDGETIILGGLRRKATQDNQDKVPFLGEIPGLGKLFGSTKLTDNNTEMFFFITPKIVLDPKEQLIQIRREELKKRPGDTPEFLKKAIEAREKERKKYFSNSFRLLFGSY